MLTNKPISSTTIGLCVLFLVAAFFAITAAQAMEPLHDYVFYMDIWDTILQGENPWSNIFNAYGPGFNVLVHLYSLDYNLPRLVFVFLWLISSLGIASIANENPDLLDTHKFIIFIILFFNPLFWIFIVKFGVNDILMTFFVLASVVLYKKEKDIPAGLLMAIAISVKFIPVFMIPFLVFSKNRIRWRFLLSVTLSLFVVFGISFVLWGSETLYPFQFGFERKSKMLSIFRFLRGQYSPLSILMDNPNLDWASTYLMLAAVIGFFFLHIKKNFENVCSSIIAIGILFSLYKVGHHQFYILLTMFVVLWISYDYKSIVDAQVQLIPIFSFIGWIAFVSFLYLFVYSYSGTDWRDILGLPTFVVSAWMIYTQIKYSLKLVDSSRTGNSQVSP